MHFILYRTRNPLQACRGICISECPQLNVPELRKATACYAAWVKNTDDYRTTSSGGVATALSRSIIKNNGIVYGAAFLPAKGVRHIRIAEEHQLDTIKGSKYVQSYIDKDCYENITIDLSLSLFLSFPFPCLSFYFSFSLSLLSRQTCPHIESECIVVKCDS